jgi:predicted ATPase/DNA-binding SARP family transcriptional activator
MATLEKMTVPSTRYTLKLLGSPALHTKESWTSLPQNRSFFLRCYLSYQADWVSRDDILLLFWPEMREARARQNLRTLLYKIKQEAFAESLETTETHLRWLAHTDVQAFQEALVLGDWNTAVQTYQGPFLERAHDGSSTFEDWLSQTRDELHTAWQDAAMHVARQHLAEGRYKEAVGLLQAILGYDFLAEEVVQTCMKAQALAGQKTAALQTFTTFKKQLRDELEMEPLEETLGLFEEINNLSTSLPKLPLAATSEVKTTYTTNLPQMLTPFVGRTLELLELANLLAESETRLVTLLGPGGIGKSRLSLRLLEEQAEKFSGGVAFVRLASLSSAADIPAATASALQLELSGSSEVFEEVLNHLEEREMLLVFDNFEHVLAGAPLIQQLLERAKKCQVITTSRILLNLPNERVYDVVGLSIPSSKDDLSVEAYDAAQFFLRSARRVRSDFTLTEEDTPALFELCFELQGMPLALELAATWVRVFSLRELVQEIRQDVGLLETTGQEVSERHKSIRSVFEHSWNLLSQEEQHVLAGLSVFRGGFDRQAAQAVTGATPRTLLSLVNKSLVRTSASGRFLVLEVIRQCAAEQLAETPAKDAQEKHAHFFLEVLAKSIDDIRGPQPAECFERLEQDLENLRTAWRWATDHQQLELLQNAEESLNRFIVARSRIEEGIELARRAVARLDEAKPEHQRFLGRVYLRLSDYSSRFGESAKAEQFNQHALRLLEPTTDTEGQLSALQNLTNLASARGNYAEAVKFESRALNLAYSLQNDRLIAKTLGRLAVFENDLGDYQNAKEHYEEAVRRFRRQNNLIGMSYNLTNLGGLLLDMGKLDESLTTLQEALPLVRKMGDRFFLPSALLVMGECNYQRRDFLAAKANFSEALDLLQETRDQRMQTSTLLFLGRLCVAESDRAQAETYLRQGLRQAWEGGDLPACAFALLAWAEFLLADKPSEAASLLGVVVSHESATRRERDQAAALLEGLNDFPLVKDTSLESWVKKLLEN